jgi:hypothetical protein
MKRAAASVMLVRSANVRRNEFIGPRRNRTYPRKLLKKNIDLIDNQFPGKAVYEKEYKFHQTLWINKKTNYSSPFLRKIHILCLKD